MKEKQIQSLLLALCLTTGSMAVYAGSGHEHEVEADMPAAEHQEESAESHTAHAEGAEDEHADADDDGHGHEEGAAAGDEGEHDEEGAIRLSDKQRQMINLKVTAVKAEAIADTVRVPGEVTFNAYRSSVISPRSNVRVVKRHVMLGDHLNQGDALVTLFSNELANRLSELRVASKEWEVVQKMGRDLAGKQRYVAANSALLQSLTQVTAFGLSKAEVERQLNDPTSRPLGEFVLRAPHNGVIQQDPFLVGQQMAAGDQLFVLVDEGEVWVEAQSSPNQTIKAPVGTVVQLRIGERLYAGKLKQIAHTIDEQTRTRMVRISVDNQDHNLHPGQFAQVDIPTDKSQALISLPEAAFTRTPDGDWGVFVELEAGEYKLQEVEVLRELRGKRIVEGLEPGTAVVTAGTFFLASEQAKAGFDIHNH